MTRAKAIEKAQDLGYSIQYQDDDDEIRFRKPNSAMNSLNMPYEYCRVYRRCASWLVEERVEPLIM